MRSHSRYLFLKRVTESLCLIFSGIEFQILDPEYESEFLYSSILGFGTYKRLLDVDLSALWCISVVCVNKSCKYWGAKLLQILNIRMAFWYMTRSGNFIHFSSENISCDGVSVSLSRIHLAARFWNIYIVQSLFFLNLKFQASSLLL